MRDNQISLRKPSRERIRRGQVPSVKFGRSIRIRESDLMALIANLPARQPKANPDD
jgi:hypothetical protein